MDIPVYLFTGFLGSGKTTFVEDLFSDKDFNETQFEGQTKTKLGNSEMRGFVETTTNEFLMAFLEENPSQSRIIVKKCIRSARAREAARKARDLTRRKNVLDSFSLPEKLADIEDRKSVV